MQKLNIVTNIFIMIIEFKQEASDFIGVLGGVPPLANFENWPINPQTNDKLVHLLTLYSNFQNDSITDDFCISIFITLEKGKNGLFKDEYLNCISVQSNSEINNLKNEYSKVILGKRNKSVELNSLMDDVIILPKFFITQRPMTDEEMEIQRTLLDESDMGIDKSSILEFPFFEQENIVPLPPMKYSFKMQINEWDIDKLSNGEYNGIFKGGFGYLWLDNNFKKLKENSVVGLFGIQW